MNITTNCHSVFSKPDTIYAFFSSGQHSCCRMNLHSRNTPQSCATLIDLEQISTGLQENKSRLAKQILSETEQNYFKRFTYLKRQREWLGGRTAAKIALLELDPTMQPNGFQDLSILPDMHGRPIPDKTSGISLSISHSGRFAVALAVKGAACGVDLQRTSTKLPGLTDRFASSRELSLLSSGEMMAEEELTRLTMLWATKEALKKKILHDQPALFSGIHLQHIARLEQHIYRFTCSINNHPEQSVMVYSFPPYILALTEMESHA
jgi:phosphopantetheinyl transferase